MKKIIFSLGVTILMTGMSFAYFEEGKTTDIDVLRRQGYSESTLKVVDWANYANKGEESTYVRYFTPRKHEGIGKAYTALKNYVDPIQDDGMFGEHQVNFTNVWRWMMDEPNYSIESVQKNNIENL